jgi:hypothetical protein
VHSSAIDTANVNVAAVRSPPALTLASEETAKDSITRIQFIHATNSGFLSVSEEQEGASVQELVVWGGLVANGAEQSLSQLVDGQSENLVSITYCPSWTKGGLLIRPKYWLGDRCGTAVFTRLTDLSIRLDPPILPKDYGWVTPALRRLRVIHTTKTMPEDDDESVEGCLPDRSALNQWLNMEAGASYCQCVLEASPNLESITISLASVAGASPEMLDWIHLLPPRPVPWQVQRLLYLAVHKPHSSCAMSLLTGNLLISILNFLGSSRWRQHVEKLSPSHLAKLGLPQDFDRDCGLDQNLYSV